MRENKRKDEQRKLRPRKQKETNKGEQWTRGAMKRQIKRA